MGLIWAAQIWMLTWGSLEEWLAGHCGSKGVDGRLKRFVRIAMTVKNPPQYNALYRTIVKMKGRQWSDME
jgi:hypothetical protein